MSSKPSPFVDRRKATCFGVAKGNYSESASGKRPTYGSADVKQLTLARPKLNVRPNCARVLVVDKTTLDTYRIPCTLT
jgi:hypothetical protein